MNGKWSILRLSLALVMVSASAFAADIGTAFTYQGFLESPPGTPYGGSCDFEFLLYSDSGGVTSVGTAQAVSNVLVSGGVFTVGYPDIDFGVNAFTGTARWLSISVCCPSACAPGALQELSPLVELSPAPHALALPGLYTQQNATSPNLIGGHSGNLVGGGVTGATIGGGGTLGAQNVVSNHFGTIGGGAGNTVSSDSGTVAGGDGNTASGGASFVGGGNINLASGFISTVAGGQFNVASDSYSTVGGGSYNVAQARYATIAGGGPSDPGDPAGTNNKVFDEHGTIGGGGNNRAGSDDADPTTATYATVAGGLNNQAKGTRATIGGGRDNVVTGLLGTISGGSTNTATQVLTTVGGGGNNDATFWGATVGGGSDNKASGQYSTIAGGNFNEASLTACTVGGGSANKASDIYSTVAGGYGNEARGYAATVGGGIENTAGAGSSSTVPGGEANTAAGRWSLAAGQRAQANHDASFVWSDSTTISPDFFASTGPNQFLIRASGGVGIGTSSPSALLDVAGSMRVDSTTLVVDDVNNRVGVRTSSPEEELDVIGTILAQGTPSTNSGLLSMKKTGTVGPTNIQFALSHRSSNNDLWMYGYNGTTFLNLQSWDYATNAVDFPADDGLTLHLDMGNDRVGIGTTDADVKLEVNGGSELTLSDNTGYLMLGDQDGENLALDNDEIQARNNGVVADLAAQPHGGNFIVGPLGVLLVDGTLGRVSILDPTPDVELDVVGDINYTGVIADVSDERLKENIAPVQDALDKVRQLRGVYFNMKDTPERRDVGLIAQDVQKVLPEAVSVVDPENGYLGVSYPSVIPLLVEAMKELQAEKDAQFAAHAKEMNELRARVEALERGGSGGVVRAGLPLAIFGIVAFVALRRRNANGGGR